MQTAKTEYFKDKYRIKSARLESWDYSSPGFYFVTVCVKDRKNCLSVIKDGKTDLTAQGDIVNKVWLDLPEHYSGIELDEFVIMPNHLHGIIRIKDKEQSVETIHELSLQDAPLLSEKEKAWNKGKRAERRKMLLPKVLGRFCMQSAKQINMYQNTSGKPFWQKRPWDHIVRDEKDLERIREYIIMNPSRWDKDEYFTDL